MAEETSPAQRPSSLDKLKPMSKETASAVQKALRQEKLLADIDDLNLVIFAHLSSRRYVHSDKWLGRVPLRRRSHGLCLSVSHWCHRKSLVAARRSVN